MDGMINVQEYSEEKKVIEAEMNDLSAAQQKKPDDIPELGGRLEIREMNLLYRAAIRQVITKLEILDGEYKLRYDHNPIHHLKSRLKTTDSIAEKLYRMGFPVSVDSAKENLTDIAGIRVICVFIEDIYDVAESLMKQDDITLVRMKDYIKNPKGNGYRSLHIVVNVPVFFSDRVENIPVEIQIRTVAMDFWASLEHQLRYKKTKNIPPKVNLELKACAEISAVLDKRMQHLSKELEGIE